ncbi:hypothetical protein CL622_03025 [archaeon]|nr:hypothetical protein [archaeon]|tara:strand:- start:45 stop:227 length:183 start_codon:yes stop_codon:yes gene_type:complete
MKFLEQFVVGSKTITSQRELDAIFISDSDMKLYIKNGFIAIEEQATAKKTKKQTKKDTEE